MHMGFMDLFLSHSGHRHVSTTRRHLQGGENKNTSVCVGLQVYVSEYKCMCRNTSVCVGITR